MGVKGYAIHLSFSPGNGVLMRDNTPKSTRTQGGDPIADYIRADTRLPAYLPYPRFLLKMEISQTAKLLYSLLLDRSTLSQKNKWLDDEGRIYIIYPIAEIAEILDKGSTTIKGALNELDTAGLLERERGGFSAPNRLYVKVPPVPQVPLTSPMLTAEWEQKLTEIAKGGADPDTFMDGIRTMVQEIVSTYSCISEDGKKLFAPEKEVIGTCPRCGQPVYEGKNNFACSDRSCGFVLWKNDRFWTSRKKELTKKMAADLLKKGRTNVKGMWSEKKQTAYDAAVILCDTGGRYIDFKLEFPKNKRS